MYQQAGVKISDGGDATLPEANNWSANQSPPSASPEEPKPTGLAGKHTFKVIKALNGEHVETLELPLDPAPTAGMLKSMLMEKGHYGQLMQLSTGIAVLKDTDAL